MQISTVFAVSTEAGSPKDSANLPYVGKRLRGVRPDS
jgi:hypothetical protein